MTTKAYSYLRFSSPEQMQGDSFRRQTKLAEDYAKAHGLELDTKTTFRDLGVSAFRGKNSETGRLAEFRDAVSSGIIPAGSVLLVESLDRISRQVARKAVRVLEDIVEAGVDVITLNDGRRYDKDSLDSFDFLMAVLLFIRANEESLTKARRVKAAWDNKRARALDRPMTSKVPGWLMLNKATSTFEVIEERAEVIRRIFQLTTEGIGQHTIARTLNEEGVPCFGDGVQWHRSYIAKVLSNSAVIGTMTPHVITYTDGKRVREAQEPVEGYFPAVVPGELWNEVRAMSGQRGRKPVVKGSPNPFAGMVRCGLCGAAMTRVSKGKKSVPSFVCTKAKTGVGCQYHAVRQRDVEAAIVSNASRIVADYPDADARVEEQYRELETKLAGVEQAISQIVDLLIATPSEALKDRLQKTEEEKAEIIHQMEGISLSPIPLPREKALDELGEGRVTTKVMHTLFERVVINPHQGTLGLQWRNDGTTELQFRWPSSPLSLTP